MKIVFSHENRLIVENAKNQLNAEGIKTQLKNEFSASGIGELSPFEAWPEIWVHPNDFSKAQAILEKTKEGSVAEVWDCTQCHEKNESTFAICWNCQNTKE
ncbi:MAG: DUF2007 domain-containing protein [Pseudomonadota bacterium]